MIMTEINRILVHYSKKLFTLPPHTRQGVSDVTLGQGCTRQERASGVIYNLTPRPQSSRTKPVLRGNSPLVSFDSWSKTDTEPRQSDVKRVEGRRVDPTTFLYILGCSITSECRGNATQVGTPATTPLWVNIICCFQVSHEALDESYGILWEISSYK